jgi:hypothetical protein
MILSNDNPTGKFEQVTAMYPVQKVLELACAAQRTNKAYIKTAEYVYSDDGSNKFMFVKHENKALIKHALGIDKYSNVEQEFKPMQLFLEQQDKELSDEIRNYYKRLMFAAIKADNEFQTEIFSLLMTEDMPANKIGFIASLPSVYERDVSKNRLDKAYRNADEGFLADVGELLLDKDCEIIQVKKSKNFEGYGVHAIIDNKIVSWYSRNVLTIGSAVMIKCKIKEHSENWQTKKPETRLNYVKIAQ